MFQAFHEKNVSGGRLTEAGLPRTKFSRGLKCFPFHCLKVNPNHLFFKQIWVSWSHKMTKLEYVFVYEASQVKAVGVTQVFPKFSVYSEPGIFKS